MCNQKQPGNYKLNRTQETYLKYSGLPTAWQFAEIDLEMPKLMLIFISQPRARRHSRHELLLHLGRGRLGGKARLRLCARRGRARLLRELFRGLDAIGIARNRLRGRGFAAGEQTDQVGQRATCGYRGGGVRNAGQSDRNLIHHSFGFEFYRFLGDDGLVDARFESLIIYLVSD